MCQRCTDEVEDQEDAVEVAGKARWIRQCTQWDNAKTLLQKKSVLQGKLKIFEDPHLPEDALWATASTVWHIMNELESTKFDIDYQVDPNDCQWNDDDATTNIFFRYPSGPSVISMVVLVLII
mgnify:CR=1 FL=1